MHSPGKPAIEILAKILDYNYLMEGNDSEAVFPLPSFPRYHFV